MAVIGDDQIGPLDAGVHQLVGAQPSGAAVLEELLGSHQDLARQHVEHGARSLVEVGQQRTQRGMTAQMPGRAHVLLAAGDHAVQRDPAGRDDCLEGLRRELPLAGLGGQQPHGCAAP